MQLRGYDGRRVEEILRFGEERYLDTTTGRLVALGRHGDLLVMVPYEIEGDSLRPVTIHATTRQQINVRLRTGRLRHV